MKKKIIKVSTGFSELGSKAENKSFGSIEAANSFIYHIESEVLRGKQENKVFGYYKTDFEIEWEDGAKWRGRYDIGDGELSFSRHVRSFWEVYGGFKKPAHFNDEQWEQFKNQYVRHEKEFKNWLENYEL